MTIDSKELEALRDTTSKVLVALLWLHLPIAIAIGMVRGTGWMWPAVFMAVFAAAATLSWRMAGNGLSTRLTFAVALMGGVSMFTFELSGHAWQIDVHMYFFAALALLVAYCDYRPILIGTVAVALHHLILNFLLPAAVFPGGTDLGRVVLHAVILVMEATVLVWLAHKLAQLFETAALKTAEVEAAHAPRPAPRLTGSRLTKRPNRIATPRGAIWLRILNAKSVISSKPSRSRPMRCRLSPSLLAPAAGKRRGKWPRQPRRRARRRAALGPWRRQPKN
jgi:hypothetical protein